MQTTWDEPPELAAIAEAEAAPAAAAAAPASPLVAGMPSSWDVQPFERDNYPPALAASGLPLSPMGLDGLDNPFGRPIPPFGGNRETMYGGDNASLQVSGSYSHGMLTGANRNDGALPPPPQAEQQLALALDLGDVVLQPKNVNRQISYQGDGDAANRG